MNSTKDNIFVNTWRSAAYDQHDWINHPEKWPTTVNYWQVHSRGNHWWYEGKVLKHKKTFANNCNICDGWWHSDHPERDS